MRQNTNLLELFDEKNISTPQHAPQTDSRVPGEDEHEERAKSPCSKARKRKMASHRK